MTFRFVPGGDLQQTLLAHRADQDELRGLAVGLLAGVEAMHAVDLLHRDLKPANIALLDGDFARPVILDLGLTKLPDVESMTKYPARMGTPLYMAPEQLRQERARRASDLWAVAVVLYEASTGHHPYISPSESVTVDELLMRMQSPPHDDQDIPADVVALITKLLSPEPYRRGTVLAGGSLRTQQTMSSSVAVGYTGATTYSICGDGGTYLQNPSRTREV